MMSKLIISILFQEHMIYYFYLSIANSYQLGKRAFVLSGNGKYEICTKVW